MHSNKFFISTTDFSNSYFAIAPGFDMNPLSLFSDKVGLFLYLNLGLDQQSVETWYEGQFVKFGFEILEKQVIPNFDELQHFELEPNYRAHLSNYFSNLSAKEQRDYSNAFLPFQDKPQFALIWSLKNIKTNKVVKLIFLTAEGLASYLALSHRGVYAPKILSTIQTCVLELPKSSFSEWLNSARQKPQFWVKGIEADGINEVQPSEPYTYMERIFEDYHCGNSYPSMQTTLREVVAFRYEN